jgi:hypothetical protein
MSKHLEGESFATTGDDLVRTSSERGFGRWEQQHLVAALDVLNAYEHERLAQCAACVPGIGMRKQYKDDPRTRVVELLKRWLRTNATVTAVAEDEVRSVCGFCRDLLNHAEAFPARNQRSFLHSIVEVYSHLQRQLRDVLKRDRTCAELIQRVLSLSRNLISDAIGYVLLAPTSLKDTDMIPSLEVVSLWQSLPSEGHPLPGRADATLQGVMQAAWSTQCGSLVSGILATPWCLRLFDGTGTKEEAKAAAERAPALQNVPASPGLRNTSAVLALLAEVGAEFEKGHFKSSGLAGAFRSPSQDPARRALLAAIGAIYDLVYLIGEVVVHFQHVSSGLGDYGAIRVAPWLHPFVDALVEKVQTLKQNLEVLNKAVDEAYVLARARGRSIEKPAPSDKMCKRAHAAFQRAVAGRESHYGSLLQSLAELKARSAPERLPELKGVLGDACANLHSVLFSQEFRQHVGDSFPTDLPRIMDDSPRSDERTKASFLQLADTSKNGRGEVAELVVEDLQEAEEVPYGARLSSGRLSNRTTTSEAWGLQEAEVHRMVRRPCGSGLMRHDTRSLVLEEDYLDIFAPHSRTEVKSRIYLPNDVSFCEVSAAPEGRIMTLQVQKVPSYATPDSGVAEHKTYRFEFRTRGGALAFQRDLLRRQRGAP